MKRNQESLITNTIEKSEKNLETSHRNLETSDENLDSSDQLDFFRKIDGLNKTQKRILIFVKEEF